METSFQDFLKSREAALFKYHPQWDFTNDEISSSSELLKRDVIPICIPPSWDLVNKYAERDNKQADVTSLEEVEVCNLFSGDRVKAEFLDTFQNMKAGGILVGDVKFEDFLETENFVQDVQFQPMPKIARAVIMQEINGRLLKVLMIKICAFSVRNFRLDFVYFHPTRGILQFERRSGSNDGKALKRLKNKQNILKRLFFTYCKLIGFAEQDRNSYYERYFPTHSYIYFMKLQGSSPDSEEKCYCAKICGNEELSKLSLFDVDMEGQNFFREETFRGFSILLAGFRPDCFISPVKCVFSVKKNLSENRANNAINYYRTGYFQNGNIQNKAGKNYVAKTLKDFLLDLQPMINDADINFEGYTEIYLSPEQQDAVGFFDHNGNFSPKCQLIVGPPGSGKTLILMLKIFILGQIEARRQKKVYYWSRRDDCAETALSKFVAKNESKFCREVKKLEWDQRGIVISEGADLIYDDEWCDSHALACFSPEHDDQIVAVVHTGKFGNATASKKHKWHYHVITESENVFRSTRYIQKCVCKFNPNKNKNAFISGHNFDGINVEEFFFDDEKLLKNMLDERIRRLIEIEGCEVKDIGLFCPTRYRRPRPLDRVFTYSPDLQSLEFPVMIVVQTHSDDIYLPVSRAICHLILFTHVIKYYRTHVSNKFCCCRLCYGCDCP